MNLVGQRIGSYIVDRELGSGGTGTVYLCKHTLIDREVAVKVLHDDQARDPDQVARFFQEAKSAAEIGHPNIIVIIDYGTLPLPGGDRTYLMMESLDGESLDRRLQRGGLSLADIAHILSQVCSALVACHGKGIVHRDLKPSNIYLCNRSFDPLFVKLLDFGTAKLTAPAPGVHRTQYGVVIGTPAYMSPEQCEGKGALDHRSDIYSLGVMLYEMLTGTLPFGGEIGDILIGHLTGTPDAPSKRNPQIPHEWEALCQRMMEKQREARFQSVTELAHALDDLRAHAAAYDDFVGRRSVSGHSGRTMIAPASEAGDHPTLRGVAVVPKTPVDPAAAACRALVEEPSARFVRALLVRPMGRWSAVEELCQTSTTSAPPSTPPELHAAWLEHPHHDPSLAAAVFVSLRTGWSTTVLCQRIR
jgi:serine/threonine protein kinase